MKTIKKNNLEGKFGFKVAERINVLGIDTAVARTGWCNLIVENDKLLADYGFINNKSENILLKYNSMIEFFQQLTNKKDKVIIEESFYCRNVKTFQKLSRVGMIVYQCAYNNKCPDIRFLLASQARNRIGLKNKKKEIVHKDFLEKFKIKLGDEDCIDALILALNGVKIEST